MKKFLFFIICALISISTSTKAQNLIIPAKSRYVIKDSTKVLVLDSLVLHKKSSLIIEGKKHFTIIAKTIIMDDRTSISAHDSVNNGTQLTIKGRFAKLGGPLIDVAGLTYTMGNKQAPNGNGGNLTVQYYPNSIVPQVNNNKAKNYLEVLTKGASTALNPYADINNIWYRINLGSGIGRPPMGIPQGKVYDSTQGTDGKAIIEAYSEK